VNLSKFFIAACLPAAILASCTPATHESAAGSPAPVASPAAVVSEVRVPTSAPASATPSIAPSVAPLSRAAQTPVPAASAVSTGAPGSAATTAPAAVPAATATASAPPSPVAAPTPAPKRVPIRPADAAPKIVSVSVSQRTMHPGQTISGTVLTSSNVASVEVRIATYSIDMQKVGVGRFAMAYTVPNVPVFFRGNYTMQVIARNSAGDQASRGIPITIR